MKKLQKLTLVTFVITSLSAGFLTTQAQAPLIISSSHNNASQIPYISAGTNADICFNATFKTMGETNIEGTSYWISDGNGYFENPFNLQTIYMPGRDDMELGFVTLSLCILPQDATLPAIHDEMVLYLFNCASY